MAQVAVAVLGPLEVRVDGLPMTLPGRRPAALLAMLALAGGRTVSVEELARGVWGDDLPDRVKGSLQTYVGRLRRLLGEGAIATDPAGYRLDTGTVDVDLDRFTELVSEAAGADAARAATLLDAAFDLWRGDLLAGLSDWIDRNERPALVERHLSAVERRADLWLEAGDADAVIVHLRPLVEQHPLRESLWVRLLAALRDAGRVAESLEWYEHVRRRLADDLGTDPSPALRSVYGSLLATGDGAAAVVEQTRMPRQLPAVAPLMVGRERELTRLDDVLTEDAPTRTAVLHGPGGSGKTTLAVRWGHEQAGSFPDGQLMVSLRGHGPGRPLTPVAALEQLLRGLGVAEGDIPADADSAGAMLRTVLVDRRVLIVIDDARNADHVRPLLPGGRSVAVVTSRNECRGLVAREGALRVQVGPLPEADAVRLLDRRLSMEDVPPAPREALRELAELCDRLPVALGIAAERASRAGSDGLARLLETLRDRDRRLDALRSGDDVSADVRAVFDASYQDLDDEAAVLYRYLGLHTDATVSVPAAGALLGVEPGRAHDVLDRLADRHSVEPRAPEWYGMHDLVRAHAAALLRQVDSATDRQAAQARLRSWYLHTAENAVRTFALNSSRRLARPPVPGVTPQEFPTHHAGMAWFVDHRHGLRTVLDALITEGEVATAGDLAILMAGYCDQIGAYDERVAMFDRLAPSAEAIGDDATLARCVSARGIYHGRRGEHALALARFERARELCVLAGDRDGELRAIYSVASTHEFLGRPDLALPMMELVVARRRDDGDAALLQSRQKLAQTYRLAGRSEDATAAAMELLTECRATDNQRGAARALDTLAEIALDRGALDEVEGWYAQAAEIYAALGLEYELARVFNETAKAQLALGRPESAPDNLRRALSIVEVLGASDTAEMNRADMEAALEQSRSPRDHVRAGGATAMMRAGRRPAGTDPR